MADTDEPGLAPSVAIVGSGPSGCYAAQFLRKSFPAAAISIFDAMPTPYGLVRYGVAADHQGTKAVTKQFDRLFERERVHFIGNVRVGHDMTFGALADAFDVVVLATGLTCDRRLTIPHSAHARVVGAGTMLRAVNGYPGLADAPELQRPLGPRVVIVGHGNVAVDALRVLAKGQAELDGSDVDDPVLAHLREHPIQQIDLLGRSTGSNAKFDIAMLKELGRLARLQIVVGETCGDDENPVIDLLRDLAARPAPDPAIGEPTVRATFHFGQVPVEITAEGESSCVVTTALQDATLVTRYPADSIITAIGFEAEDPAPATEWTGPNVWRTGWLRRGPRGTIPENRRDAAEIAETIGNLLRSGELPVGKPGLPEIWSQIADRAVDFHAWRRIDAHELQQAPDGRCRRKVTDIHQMLTVALGANDTPAA